MQEYSWQYLKGDIFSRVLISAIWHEKEEFMWTLRLQQLYAYDVPVDDDVKMAAVMQRLHITI